MEPGAAPLEAFWPPSAEYPPNPQRHNRGRRRGAFEEAGGGGRYERLGKIGEGGFGEVAAGLDRLTGRVVAIKSVQLGNNFEKGGSATHGPIG